jgi:hypothetical protein
MAQIRQVFLDISLGNVVRNHDVQSAPALSLVAKVVHFPAIVSMYGKNPSAEYIKLDLSHRICPAVGQNGWLT